MTPHLRRLVAPAGAGLAAAGAIGFVLSERVLRPRRRPRLDHRVLAVSDASVTLASDEEMLRPGRYGVHWRGGHAVIGPVLGDLPSRRGGSVERVLERVDLGTLHPGRVGLGHVSIGDPASAHGLAYEEVLIDSDVGGLPCWEVPPSSGSRPADGRPVGPSGTWALVVHGYGGSRASALDMLPILHGLGMPTLAIAYRNDPGAPSSPDHRYHLGASEWRDLDAAIAYASGRGAQRVLLVGWSMGGAIVMQAYARSPRRHLVAGIVLDCPVLDWRAVLDAQGRRRRVPVPIVALASRLVEHRIGTRLEELDWTDQARAGGLEVPVLVFHGEEDPVVPLATSRSFAAAAPHGLVELEVTPRAGHIGSWYTDSSAYERRVAGFCARLGDLVASSPAADASLAGT